MSIFGVHGASGREYHYNPVNLANPSLLTITAANYLFVRVGSAEHEIVFVGETPSLYEILTKTQLWPKAQRQYGATAVFARPNARDAGRQQERDDLVEAYKPPMNAVDQG
jgi:hypothetical protein